MNISSRLETDLALLIQVEEAACEIVLNESIVAMFEVKLSKMYMI